MWSRLVIGFKTLITAILIGGTVVASFYVGYLLLVLVTLLIIVGIAYLFFNRDKVVEWFNSDD